MNLKVMNRIAVGTLFASSVALGMTSCGNTGKKNVDRILDRDVVELSQGADIPAEKPAEISYEHNTALDERFHPFYENRQEELDELYKTLGTYGATMYVQNSYQAKTAYLAALEEEQRIYNIINKESSWDTRKEHPLYEEDRELEALVHDCHVNEIDHEKGLENEMQEYLFSEGVPTLDKCMSYVDRRLANLRIPMEDYEEALKEIKEFEDAQGAETTQSKAELLAFKISIIRIAMSKVLLEQSGAIENIRIRNAFNKLKDNAYSRPKP